MRTCPRRTSTSRLTLAAALALLAPALASPTPVQAQDDEPMMLGYVVQVTPLRGQSAGFEAGMAGYLEDFAAQGLTTEWHTFEVMTGENAGSYYVTSFGHTWSTMDAVFAEGSGLDDSFRANIEPRVEDAHPQFMAVRPDLSHMSEMGSPPRLSQLFWIRPHMAEAQAFEASLREMVGAAADAEWPYEWIVYQRVNGGVLPQYVVQINGESFADFAEPDPSMFEMMQEQMGEDEAQAFFEALSATMAYETSEMVGYREDLSYIP